MTTHKSPQPSAPESSSNGAIWAILVALLLLFLVVSSTINTIRANRTAHQTGTAAAQEVAAAETVAAQIPTQTPLPTPTFLPRNFTDSAGIQMALISGGKFLMGADAEEAFENCQQFFDACDLDWFTPHDPIHRVYVDDYFIDIYEVTNAAYDACVQAGACTQPHRAPASSTREEYYLNPAYNTYPVIMVDWFQAEDYCTWRGARLPTEAEWEKAARGRLDGMDYSWGNEAPSCEPGSENGANFHGCGLLDTMEVGTFAPNGYGIYDMTGNVWEWVADGYDAAWYSQYPAEDWPDDPTGPEIAPLRVLRGGGWINDPSFITTAIRGYRAPSLYFPGLGFRCVVDPVEGTNLTPAP
jgi:formylglycine-generating enzyme required for sulfatase activity